MPQAALAPGRTRSTPALLASASFAAAFVLVALPVELKWPTLTAFDRDSVAALRRIDGHSALFVAVMRTVSAVASTTGWLVVLGVVTVFLAVGRRGRTAVFVAVTGAGSAVLNAALKDVFHRPRPALAHPIEVARGWSFPSGHTQAATVGCAVLLVVFLPGLGRVASRWAVAGAVGVVAAVALSRMALGVHYPSDVAGSVLFGLAWTSFTAWAVSGPDRPDGDLEQGEPVTRVTG